MEKVDHLFLASIHKRYDSFETFCERIEVEENNNKKGYDVLTRHNDAGLVYIDKDNISTVNVNEDGVLWTVAMTEKDAILDLYCHCLDFVADLKRSVNSAFSKLESVHKYMSNGYNLKP